MELNHRKLCEIGSKFLRRAASANGHGCHFALIEPASYGENPDVIGYRHGMSGFDVGTTVLEAKTSRSDFLVDKKKPHRQDPETGMGRWRYYICPTDLIKPSELPERWGLIYVNSRGHCDVIAGAMAVPKIKHVPDYGARTPFYYRDSNQLVLSFETHSFEQRNIINEQNLLVMALARMDDPEQILYMQRSFTKIQAERDTLRRTESSLNRKVNIVNLRLEKIAKSEDQLIRSILLLKKDYIPPCKGTMCIRAPVITFNGSQFQCDCGWQSSHESEFICEYKEQWGL